MIGLLLKLGLSEKVAKLLAYVAVPLLILAAFYLALDAYGDSRYREGKTAEAEAWKAAEERLLKKSAEAGARADKAAAARQAEHAAAVAEEREKVDEAVANGSSPLDVLFGG